MRPRPSRSPRRRARGAALRVWAGPLLLAALAPLGCGASTDARLERAVPFLNALSGPEIDSLRDVAVDAEGNLYATGGTASPGFPVTDGAYDTTFNGWHDVWVMKLDPAGRIVWSTFLGGPQYDRAYALELAPNGDVVVAGRAGEGFPVTAHGAQPGFGGDLHPNELYGPQDGFIVRLSNDGARLLAGTFLGGPDEGMLRDVAVDGDGFVYVGGGAREPHPQVRPTALFPHLRGEMDGFLAKLLPDLSRVVYATYVGGSGEEVGQPSVRVDAKGRLHALFVTRSKDATTTPGVLQPQPAARDELYLVRLSPGGDALELATYFGGSGNEAFETHNLALAPNGDMVIAATSNSPDLPVPASAWQPRYAGGSGEFGGDGVVLRIAADGTRLVAGTYFGGSGNDGFEGVSVLPNDEVVVSGVSGSKERFAGLRLTPAESGDDGVILRLAKGLDRCLGGLRVGGAGIDTARASAVGGRGTIAVGGMSDSDALPTRGPFPTRALGHTDAWIARVLLDDALAPETPAP